jgi:Zyg-11 family protein
MFSFSYRNEVLIQLSELYFRSCSFISNQSISKHLLYHDLIEIIDLRDCNINYKIFQILTNNFPRLTTLYLGQTENKHPSHRNLNDFFPNNLDAKYYLAKPKLKYLSIEGVSTSRNDTIDDIFYKSLTQSSEQIRYLDISRNSALESLTYIDCFKQIHSLILYDILPAIIEAAIDSICILKTLVLLDLSLNRRSQESASYSKPTITLAKLIRSLPKLLSLDISGTNLAGAISFVEEEELAYIKKELSIDQNEYVLA